MNFTNIKIFIPVTSKVIKAQKQIMKKTLKPANQRKPNIKFENFQYKYYIQLSIIIGIYFIKLCILEVGWSVWL